MNAPWPRVRLGDVLRPTAREERVDALTECRLLGVRLDGQGAFLRETVMGTQTAATKLYRVAEGDFIYSRLFACRGAFGVIRQDLDGCYVSGEFPTFGATPDRLDLNFLRYWFRLPPTLARVNEDCTGSTPLTRNRFKEQFILQLELPLPPLAEQRRVVARIEEMAAQINEAGGLRQQVDVEREALSSSLLEALLPPRINTRTLGELIAPDSSISYGVLVPGADVEDGVPFVRVQDLSLRSPSRQPNKRIAAEVDAQYERTRLKGGEILIGVVGSIGKVGIAPASWAGANIARAVCRIAPSAAIERDYLALILSAKSSQDYFRATTRTLAQPTLNVAQLSKTPVPVPALAEQRRIVAAIHSLQSQTDALQHLQSEASAELDALLPAILDRAFKGEL